MSELQRLWVRAWCFFMYDAISGPMQSRPKDQEREIEYWSRAHARDDVLALHRDFVHCCNAAFPNADPDDIRDAFASGKITKAHIDEIWRASGGD